MLEWQTVAWYFQIADGDDGMRDRRTPPTAFAAIETDCSGDDIDQQSRKAQLFCKHSAADRCPPFLPFRVSALQAHLTMRPDGAHT